MKTGLLLEVPGFVTAEHYIEPQKGPLFCIGECSLRFAGAPSAVLFDSHAVSHIRSDHNTNSVYTTEMPLMFGNK